MKKKLTEEEQEQKRRKKIEKMAEKWNNQLKAEKR